jgi:4-amino-4-deoxy-L-arabinose transferase-like glycosyltransferase
MTVRSTVGKLHPAFWRSPTDQPRWARPVLLVIASLAGLSYGWALNQDYPEMFYAAAVRSMSMSWKNFFYGAFEPWGTVTVDKLPGELWVQALFVRALGFHTWAIMLPQAIEGALTILVLYRAVRRLAGPVAGIIAALCLATSPATVLLNRGNISDTLLTLLLTLAADAASFAITTGNRRSILLSGLWIGLAFQAKMVEAWVLIPVVAGACLLAYRPPRGLVGRDIATSLPSASWRLPSR